MTSHFETDLKKFEELTAGIAVIVTPMFGIVITDAASNKAAVDAAKQLKPYIDAVEDRRDMLVRPLNDQVKAWNSMAKDVRKPLEDAMAHLTKQRVLWETELARTRKLADDRIAAEKAAAERVLAEERAKAAKELAERQERERAQAKEAQDLGFADSTQEDVLAEKHAEARAEQALADANELKRVQQEHERRQWDLQQQKTRGVSMVWDFEVTDLALVPRHFLKIEPNSQAILAAARGGTPSIPGVRLFQVPRVSTGKYTYVPTAALKAGG